MLIDWGQVDNEKNEFVADGDPPAVLPGRLQRPGVALRAHHVSPNSSEFACEGVRRSGWHVPCVSEHPGALGAKRWGLAIDIQKCMSVDVARACQRVCHRIHNVPQIDLVSFSVPFRVGTSMSVPKAA